MSLKEKQSEFVELFDLLGSWLDRFQYLIDRGRELPEMPENLRNASTKISSCISQTFFLPTAPNGIIQIQGWSNADVPSGLIAILKDIFEGSTVDELRSTPIDFLQTSGLLQNMTANRQASVLEMVNRVIRL